MEPPASFPPVRFTPESITYDEGPALFGEITTLMVLAIITIVLRFWMRLHRRMDIKLDDWLIGASAVPFLGLIACSYCSIFLAGVGKHYQVNIMVDPTRLVTSLRILYASLIVVVLSITLVKLSILSMYYRIFPTRFMKYNYIILGTIILLWATSTLLACIFQCTPIRRAWDFNLTGKCINSFALFIGTGGVPNLLIDVALLVLPMWEVYKLQVSTVQKIAIATNFLLGLVVIVTDMFKLVILVEIYRIYEADHNQWAVMDKFKNLIMWVIIEHALSIICANAPTLRPIMGIFRRRTSSLSKNNSGPSILVGRRVPNLKEGLVTIGGTGAASQSNGTGKQQACWPSTLTQETLVGEENMAPCERPSLQTTARSNSLTTRSITNNTHSGKPEDTDSSAQIASPPAIWPTRTEYRVTINSNHNQRPTNRSLRGFHVHNTSSNPAGNRPNTGGGGSYAVPVHEIPAIAVTTDTEVAWDDDLQRVPLARSDSDRIGVGL